MDTDDADYGSGMPPLPHVDRIGPNRHVFVMATEHEYGPALRACISPLITGVGPIEAAEGTAAALAALATADALPDAIANLGFAGWRRLPLGVCIRSAACPGATSTPRAWASRPA